MNFVLAAMAAASLLAAGGPSNPPPSATAPTPATAAADENEVICKTIPVTGTRFPERKCHTKAEWAGITAQARDFTDKATRPACGLGCGGH